MPGKRTEGFTLLEVVVALAIAGLALVLLFRAGGAGLVAANTASHAEEAVERAQSHLAAIGRDAALVQGDFEGDDGGDFHWRLRIHPIASWSGRTSHGRPAGHLTLFDVEVAISWPGHDHNRAVVLKTRRIGLTRGSQ